MAVARNYTAEIYYITIGCTFISANAVQQLASLRHTHLKQ